MVLVVRSEVKRPLGRPRRRREDNIKMDLKEISINEANWSRLAQNTVQWRTGVNIEYIFDFHKKAYF
jgi:hypothetical protein